MRPVASLPLVAALAALSTGAATAASNSSEVGAILLYPKYQASDPADSASSLSSDVDTYLIVTNQAATPLTVHISLMGDGVCDACSFDLPLTGFQSVRLRLDRQILGTRWMTVISDASGSSSAIPPAPILAACSEPRGFVVINQQDPGVVPPSTLNDNQMSGSAVVVDLSNGTTSQFNTISLKGVGPNDGDRDFEFNLSELTALPESLSAGFWAPNASVDARLILFNLDFKSRNLPPPTTACTLTGSDAAGNTFTTPFLFDCWEEAPLGSISPMFAESSLGSANGVVTAECEAGTHGVLVTRFDGTGPYAGPAEIVESLSQSEEYGPASQLEVDSQLQVFHSGSPDTMRPEESGALLFYPAYEATDPVESPGTHDVDTYLTITNTSESPLGAHVSLIGGAACGPCGFQLTLPGLQSRRLRLNREFSASLWSTAIRDASVSGAGPSPLIHLCPEPVGFVSVTAQSATTPRMTVGTNALTGDGVITDLTSGSVSQFAALSVQAAGTNDGDRRFMFDGTEYRKFPDVLTGTFSAVGPAADSEVALFNINFQVGSAPPPSSSCSVNGTDAYGDVFATSLAFDCWFRGSVTEFMPALHEQILETTTGILSLRCEEGTHGALIIAAGSPPGESRFMETLSQSDAGQNALFRSDGCGDGTMDAGEFCDDGNPINGDGCDANCSLTACGNGLQSGGEPCDDGNTADNDGCAASCLGEALCGSGVCDSPQTLPSIAEAIEGLEPGSGAGSSVSGAGDLDGDGLQDVLSGAPSHQTGGAPVEAGAAVVHLGSADAAERGTADIVFLGESAHDRAGTVVAGRFDFNGDTRPDILIGAEQVNRTATNDPVAGCNAGSPCGSGRVYLIYFDPADYPNIDDPALPDIVNLSDVGGSIPGVVFTGASLGDLADLSAAAGGRMDPGLEHDIAIGAPGRDLPGKTNAGAVYVIFDDASLSGVVSLSRVANGQGDEVDGIVYEGESAGDALGSALAFPGHVTLPPGEDLLAGAPLADPIVDGDMVANAGKAYVIAGGSLATGVVPVGATGGTLPGAQIHGDQPGEQLGSALAGGGDNLQDGIRDVLVGAPLHDTDTDAEAGRVIQTSAFLSGFIRASDVGDPDPVNPDAIDGAIWVGSDSGDRLGSAVAGVGDVTNDGTDDIVLTAPHADPDPTLVDAGELYLINGATSTRKRKGVTDVSSVGEATPGMTIVGVQAGELAGTAVAETGDIDGDGSQDFVVGAPGGGGTGRIYIATKTQLPTSGCDETGCVIINPITGGRLELAPGVLGGAVGLQVLGVASELELPAPVPPGMMLAAAAGFTPLGQFLEAPGGRIHAPVLPTVDSQLLPGEILDLSRYDGSGWAADPAGFVSANPLFVDRKAVEALFVSPLGFFAVFLPDQDEDLVRDSRDNCPLVFNPSQSDGDGDSAGDACDSNPVLIVSSDPNDVGDYAGIQEAVNAAMESGTRIHIRTGDGSYQGVILDRNMTLHFEGIDDGSGPPVIVGDSNGPALDLVFAGGAGKRVTVRGLKFRGTAGIRASVPTNIEQCWFEDISGVALDLNAGQHRTDQLVLGPNVHNGIRVNGGASLVLTDSTFDDIGSVGLEIQAGGDATVSGCAMVNGSGTAIELAGSALVETTLIAQSAEAIHVSGTGSLLLRHATVAASAGTGLGAAGGASLDVDHVILYGNGGLDLVGVGCAVVSWSDVGTPDCTGVNDNVSVNPDFEPGSYRLAASSPLVEYGPHPSVFVPQTCRDLDGGQRVRDFDGDGLAFVDPGAYEKGSSLSPGAVTGLEWTDEESLLWQEEPSAALYHVYRGLISNIGYAHFGVCADGLDSVLTDESLGEPSVPPAGEIYFYVVSAESLAGAEGSLGLATCVERSNFTPCP